MLAVYSKRIIKRNGDSVMRESLKGVSLLLILVCGVILQYAGILDFSGMHIWIEVHAQHWWAAVLFLLLMVGMYALALPASPLMLLAGVMYRPLPATGAIVLGGTIGSIAAYYIAGRLSVDMTKRYVESRRFKIIQRNAGFPMLSALRLFPGFPHSVINYSAGILKIDEKVFILSAIVGFVVKGFVYSSAVYHSTHVDAAADGITLRTLWPLFLLSLLLAGGMVIHRRFSSGNG